jgi:16S rRNA (guanine966-N2)-methyltransferase
VQRIGSGTLRGRVLRPLPAGIAGVRPTGSRVREAIFDRLQVEVRDAHVLDPFAGTGALAFEAISRGAARATLVDVQPRVVRFLQQQVREFSLEDRVTVHPGEAVKFLQQRPPATRYGLVLLDPPYDATAEQVPRVLAALIAGDWLAPDALVVCEYDRSHGSPPAHGPAWALEASRAYGETGVDFLRWVGA